MELVRGEQVVDPPQHTVTVSVYGWDFRVRHNGIVECRNKSLELDWATRRAEDIDFLDDQLAVIRDKIFDLHSIFPKEPQHFPKSTMVVQQPFDTSKVV